MTTTSEIERTINELRRIEAAERAKRQAGERQLAELAKQEAEITREIRRLEAERDSKAAEAKQVLNRLKNG